MAMTMADSDDGGQRRGQRRWRTATMAMTMTLLTLMTLMTFFCFLRAASCQGSPHLVKLACCMQPSRDSEPKTKKMKFIKFIGDSSRDSSRCFWASTSQNNTYIEDSSRDSSPEFHHKFITLFFADFRWIGFRFVGFGFDSIWLGVLPRAPEKRPSVVVHAQRSLEKRLQSPRAPERRRSEVAPARASFTSQGCSS